MIGYVLVLAISNVLLACACIHLSNRVKVLEHDGVSIRRVKHEGVEYNKTNKEGVYDSLEDYKKARRLKELGITIKKVG